MIHLCWICAEEGIDLDLEKIYQLVEFTDLRNAINSLALKQSTNIEERDRHYIDEYSKMLFAHETMGHNDIDVISTFSDLLCVNDVADFKSTRQWYTELTSDYIDENNFEYNYKQSVVARNAQMTHRVSCLRNACKVFSINPPEMNMYSVLYRKLLLNNINPLKTGYPNYEYEAKALYTIAKIGASSPQCKILKKTLKIR